MSLYMARSSFYDPDRIPARGWETRRGDSSDRARLSESLSTESAEALLSTFPGWMNKFGLSLEVPPPAYMTPIFIHLPRLEEN